MCQNNKTERNSLISIITVCYNEKKIENTCKSVINQTFKNFEWIVVDGGSNVGTIDILKKYEKNMAVFISEKDDGIYDAMNKGIKKAKGEWLIFMNGGDCFHDNKVLDDIFPNNCNHDCDIIFSDGINNIYNTKHPLPINRNGRLLLHKFFMNNSLCHQATFIKKHLFEKIGLYDTSYKIIADHAFNYIAIKDFNAIVKYIPRVIALVDVTGVSMKKRGELEKELYRLRLETRDFFVESLIFLKNKLNFLK